MADSDPKHTARELLGAHADSITTLHQKVAALNGGAADTELSAALSSYKKAHEKYASDVLGILGTNT
ncbi:MAG: hypothetical protein NVSMB19_26730 [Vulcanimicrobiaceae bacterium]